MTRKDERKGEVAEALARVGRDSETLGSSALARAAKRAGDHFSGADAVGEAPDGGTDPVEVWGRRIGRGLGAVLFIVLVVGLVVQLAER